MKIAVRMEGGLGDHLCANRFVAAILDKYPKADVTAYSDTEGQTFQREALVSLYPDFYKEVKVIPERKYKKMIIKSVLGTENFPPLLSNIPDEYLSEMKSADKFYDLHIDSFPMEYKNYDFEWLRYFHFFPKPTVDLKSPVSEDSIVFHLDSAASSDINDLSSKHCENLVAPLAKHARCLLIAKDPSSEFYSWTRDHAGVELISGTIKSIADYVSGAKLFVGIDSGFKFLAHALDVPALVLSRSSLQPNSCINSFHVRWLMWPNICYPLYTQPCVIHRAAKKILEEKILGLVPQAIGSNYHRELMIRSNISIEKKE
jgi:ADP-heptose:LPS heptosyltransferase